VAAEVADGNILTLLERFLAAGVMEDGVFKPTTIGTPQGGVVTPPTILPNFRFCSRLPFREPGFGLSTARASVGSQVA